ncbi:MAG: hypothetical protein F4Y82_05295 [Cenarchaeum sp. SB0665_bin_23]|nr:hypothetical protein [Cenarchaeum sp. SB0665_bin_23]MYG32838.1 hypothetical protein [Cenarchaeum sp. SB0677_bin_16]
MSVALLLANQKKKEVRKNELHNNRHDKIRWNRYRKASLLRLRCGQRRQRFGAYEIQKHARAAVKLAKTVLSKYGKCGYTLSEA